MSDSIKVPSELLFRQYGGLTTAHETRKTCFLALAPRFLADLGAKLGTAGQIDKELSPTRGSGTVALTAPQLHMEISEDAALRDGLILRYRIGPAGGPAEREATVRLMELNREGASAHLVNVMRTALQAAARRLH